jgi:hypothetical protein
MDGCLLVESTGDGPRNEHGLVQEMNMARGLTYVLAG